MKFRSKNTKGKDPLSSTIWNGDCSYCWCRLKDGGLLCMTDTDNGIEEEYEDEGYVGYCAFLLYFGGSSYDGGEYAYKEGWTFGKFAKTNKWKIEGAYDLGEDGWELYDAIEGEDWDAVAELAARHPALFEGIRV